MTEESNEAIDFAELSSDEPFKESVISFQNNVNKIRDVLKTCCDSDLYNELNSENKVKYDLFLSYSLNSLFWLYLRTQGHNPNDHGIKRELERIKGFMAQAKKAEERKSAPKLDQGAAKRFVRHALWTPEDKNSTNEDIQVSNKRKRED